MRRTTTNASTAGTRQQRQDATVRLVHALNSEADEASLDLAHRILDSQLGGSGIEASSATDFSSIWKRRMELSSLPPHQQDDIEQCYRNLVYTSRSIDKELPAKVMTVLTKLIHHSSNTDNNNPPLTTRQQRHHAKSSEFQEPPVNMALDAATTPNQWSNAMRYEEAQVLRELLYALQGLQGNRIKFHDNNRTSGMHVMSPSLINHHKDHPPSRSKLGSGAMDALRLCGEAGWLVKRLESYVAHHNSQQPQGSGAGRITRALAQTVAHEIQAYTHTLAQWESQWLHEWSLRQWLVHIQQGCLPRLTVLCMLTEALPRDNTGGGTLLSALYMHSLHGDVRHKSLVQSILYPTSLPWFHMLYLWTTQGLLPESWGDDFFVILQPEYVAEATTMDHYRQSDQDNKYLWHDKYTLNKSQIPHEGIFDPALVRPAFVVGKGINFIRTCLHQVGWTLHLESEDDDGDDVDITNHSNKPLSNKEENKDDSLSQEVSMERLGYHFVAEPLGMHLNPRLTRTLQRAEQIVHSHILRSLRQDHNLLDHLFALKQFLFHGQGDFFSSLLESLYKEFGCGSRRRQTTNTSFVTGHAVAGVYPQQLLAMMEAALRTTNAKDLPSFCLERLRVEMLPLELLEEPLTGPGHGLFTTPRRNLADADDAMEQDHASISQRDTRTVWDVFMLDYNVPDPLVAIVHENALEQYKLVYSFLFGLRKVEYMLNSTWRQSATLQHALQVMAQYNGLRVATSPEYAQATVLLRKIAMTRQAMTHFCVNLKSYCMLEVLEGGWKQLQARLELARTLDEAIQAHDYYLEGICRKCLLIKGRTNRRRHGAEERPRNNKFAQLFRVILSVATEFCSLQERLFDEAQDAAERVAQRRREAEKRMTHGQWGFENEQDLAEEEAFFGLADAKELAEVARLAEAFHQCMQTLLEALDAKVHGKSRNMSTTASINEDDEDEWDAGMDYYDVPPAFIDSGEEDDIDSLRFLMFQLDHNGFYGR